MTNEPDKPPADKRGEPDLIITDLHRRITGVGATIRTVAPYLNEHEAVALVATRELAGLRRYTLGEALRLCRSEPGRGRPFRIWHARRNNEMLWGLIFKHLFRCRLKLVMTSAAIRRHSWFPRQLLRRMDAVIATSDQAATFVDKVIAVIPHGVDCRRFVPAADRRAALRALGITGEYGVGIVGRVRPEKGTDLFVEAMIRVLPKRPGFTACIVGLARGKHEAFEQELRRKIDAAGLTDRFAWLGELSFDRMPGFHAAMSLCAAPARYEGFGLTPLEAMACGAPVVASRTGAYPRVIEEGVTGALVDCGDVDALAAALDRLMAEPARLARMGEACRRNVTERWSVEAEARGILGVYEGLWGKGK
ncbi:MAG: glycosyltransferase family 4 protein [Phycisphaeraceae bacterium]|nr:glycosyltransferase family 4 protein [Phycisphaeraceae bacterium]